jgi:hypothetical protein
MRSDREERIKQRAYALWQSEGHRHGRHEDHWHRAEREIAAEEAGPGALSKAPRRAARVAKPAAKKSAAATPARSRSASSEMRGEKAAAPKKRSTRSSKPEEKT